MGTSSVSGFVLDIGLGASDGIDESSFRLAPVSSILVDREFREGRSSKDGIDHSSSSILLTDDGRDTSCSDE
jgi:hypothetical protein